MPNKKYGIITVDRSQALVSIITGSECRYTSTRQLYSRIPSKKVAEKNPLIPRAGKGLERLVEIAIHEWYARVASIAHKMMNEEKCEKCGRILDVEPDAIFVSGSSAERFVTHYF